MPSLRDLILITFLVITLIGGYMYIASELSPPKRLIIATTTSTVDTGLLEYLKPYYDRKFGANMAWLSLGTGQAMQVAARGDADILLVHDRVREDAFIESGNGTHRVTIMYNDYTIVGPSNDPADVKDSKDASDAFRRISQAGELRLVIFVSRDDGSGTNAAELRLWSQVGISPKEKSWYLRTGSGMAATIRVTNDLPATLPVRQGYTLTDRGTWLKLRAEMQNTLTLEKLFEGDPQLANPYGLILLNFQKYPNINNELAEKFFLFMVSEEGQELIADFKVNGTQLFFPIFGKAESLGLPSESVEVAYWVQKLKDAGMKPPPWLQ